MKEILLLMMILTFLSCGSKNEKQTPETNVLFIGNSLTYYNDMPRMLQEMMNQTHPDIIIDQITYPGMSLDGHLDKILESESENNISTRSKRPDEITETERKIREKDWDIIILQTGGVTVLIPESVQYSINPAIQKMKDLATNETRFILFNTWTAKIDFPKTYCYRGMQIDPSLERMKEFCSPTIENPDDFLFRLNSSYKSIAENHGLERTTHGIVFQRVSEEHPEMELLEDDMHPSKSGAFLSACIFYEIITKKDAGKLEYTADLDPEKAEILKNSVS